MPSIDYYQEQNSDQLAKQMLLLIGQKEYDEYKDVELIRNIKLSVEKANNDLLQLRISKSMRFIATVTIIAIVIQAIIAINNYFSKSYLDKLCEYILLILK